MLRFYSNNEKGLTKALNLKKEWQADRDLNPN